MIPKEFNYAGETMEETATTASIQIHPETDSKIQALYREGETLHSYAEALVITSDDAIRATTSDLSIIAGLKKAIEKRRREYVNPLNDHLKTVNAAFKGFVQPLTDADSLMREKILAYRAEQERIRAEEERINALRIEAAEAEMKLKGEITEPVDIVPVQREAPARYRTDVGTLGTSKRWQFEVEDFALLPDEYKEPDTTKIRRVIQAGASIPGVKAWQEEGLRVTSRASG